MSVARTWSPVLLLCLAVGCRHTPPATAVDTPRAAAPAAVRPAPPAPTLPPGQAPPQSPPAPLTDADRFRQMSLDDLNASRPLGDVFFDYDQTTLRADAQRALQSDAHWLAQWPTTVVRIDGSCDERGSAEYNLALGDKRAVAAKTYLAGLGITPDRIQVRSLGKDAPFCRESNEACWSQNRRGHMVITAK